MKTKQENITEMKPAEQDHVLYEIHIVCVSTKVYNNNSYVIIANKHSRIMIPLILSCYIGTEY